MDTQQLKVGDYVKVVTGEWHIGRKAQLTNIRDEGYGVQVTWLCTNGQWSNIPIRHLEKITKEEAALWILSN